MTKLVSIFALAAALAAAPAAAGNPNFVFQVTGGGALDSYSFTVPAKPSPAASTAHSFSLFDVPSFGDIGFGPVDYLASYNFYDTTLGGGFDGGYSINVYSGPKLFTGSTAAPRFIAGNYAFTDFYGQATNLNISLAPGVPEPASWALLLAGFAMTGTAVRSRRRVVRARSADAAGRFAA